MTEADKSSYGAEEAPAERRSCWKASKGIGSADVGAASEVARLVKVRRREACTAEQVVRTLEEAAAEEAKVVSSFLFPRRRQAVAAMTIPCHLARRA